MREILGFVGIAFSTVLSFGIIASPFLLAYSGHFFSCYEGKLEGTAQYRFTVRDKGGQTHEPHTVASQFAIDRLARWKAGDELLICNAIVTNRTRQESATCGDFGCLAIWP